MQNKGIVIVTAVLLTLASIFYLSFSVATKHIDSQAAQLKDAQAQQDYKDSATYLFYSYQECQETQIGLGLDLKGGMNVILEISVPDVLERLADNNSTNPEFAAAMKQARTEEEKSQSDFLSLFLKNYKGKLATVFATQRLEGRINPQSSDAEVEKVLREEIQSAIDNSFNVVRNRIDKFGVAQPNIQKLAGHEGQIMVEMPGVREPERVRKLLQGSANLEFWETYDSENVIPALSALNQALIAEADSATAAALPQGGPLCSKLQLGGSLSIVGYANAKDTAEVNKYIYSALANRVFSENNLNPKSIRLLWGAKEADPEMLKQRHIFELYAIKVPSDGKAPLEGDVVTDAKDEFDQFTGKPEVSMTMNAEGARRWAALTKKNIDHAVAIVLDGEVYSAPRVNQEISGGRSSISGNFSIQDTKDLANTLKSGRMPARARIVSDEVVGPTLGAQSIQQGIISFIIAFVLLMVYMVVMYNFNAGMMANLALIVNLFFTLGILTSFQAALTMSGIAGLVLSLGTAVDANVLIYERIKEEMKKGLGLKQAISAGYSNAFSAIFDSNLTSVLTGIILLSFGTGPIKGFAVTWIIGIACSFFTAVFLTRLVYEHQINHDRWKNIKFCTPLSKNLMQGTRVRFMSLYKKTFVLVGVLAVVFLVSFFKPGFNQGIDFTGGRNYVVQFANPTTPEKIRPIIAAEFEGSNTSALAIGTDGKTARISTNYMIDSNDSKVDDETEQKLYNCLKGAGLISCSQDDFAKQTAEDEVKKEGIISSQKVGPSVAKDITHGAIISVIIALIAIFLYILVRFRNVAFSIGSIVALAFDTLFVLGIYCLCWKFMPFSLEIDQTFIGAILTVIGYSINDKVVVFDRIRENLRLHKKQDYQTTFNDSINQTLARTINTSVSTLLVLLCIFFLGGDSIRSFSFAMILGVVFGTCSSIFIASPVAYLVMGRKIEDRIALDKAAAAAEAE